MLALSPSVFSSFGWPLDEPIGHDQQLHIQTPIETTSDQSFLPQYHHLGYGDDSPKDKKIFHNASERDRRKKMNTLYSSLRSLLPASDQTKKLSIPNTISRALKYIPELQREVKDLLQLKEELISKNSMQEDLLESRKKLKRAHGKASSSISTSQLSERELLVQICVTKSNQNSLSDVLVSLEEEDELALLNASCFQSIGEWVFYNLHIQGKGPEYVDLVQLREKLLAYCDKSGEPCSP